MIEYFIRAARAAKASTDVTAQDLIDAKDKHALISDDTKQKLEKLKAIVSLIVKDVEAVRKRRKMRRMGCKKLFWILVRLYKHDRVFANLERRDKIWVIAILTQIVTIYREQRTREKDKIIEYLYELKTEEKKKWVVPFQNKVKKLWVKPAKIYKRKIEL